MKKVIRENIVKNLILVALLVPAYFNIHNFVNTSPLVLDKSLAGTVFVAVSILAVTACFGNFAFTYERVAKSKIQSRYFAHVTTALLMLLIGLSLEMTAVLLEVLVGNFVIFNLSLVFLYVASVFYDFWDLERAYLRN